MPDKKPIKIHEYLPHHFSSEEKLEIASRLAHANQQVVVLEERKKQIDADLKAQIESERAVIAQASRQLNQGHEHRDIECVVDFHTPKKGHKRITRLDTGEVVRETKMTPEELQEELPFEVEAAVN